MSGPLAPGIHNLFLRMARGEVPCHCIADSSEWFAFLDINPLAVGHTLVVPKVTAERIEDLPAATMAAFGPFLQKVIQVLIPNRTPYNILQNNGAPAHQAVMQVHYHIIPKGDNDGLNMEWATIEAASDELATQAAALRAKFEALP